MDLLTLRQVMNSGKSIFELPLRVVYYARVSTDKTEQLNSLENQVFYFEDYINKNTNWTYAGGYIDEGLSGTSTTKRVNFLKMIKDGKENKFDLVITKEISRFARDTLDSIQYTRELLTHGVGVYFQSDNINTLSADSELRLTIMASIAQDEVRKLSERLKFGYKRSIERGRVLGQNNILGYDKANGVLTINEEQAKIVRRIFEIYLEGKIGIRGVARQLEKEGMVSPFTGRMLCSETIKHVITNPKYKGYYCSGKTVSLDYRSRKRIRLPTEEWNILKDDNIPAIIEEDLWNRANELYMQRSQTMKNHGQKSQSRYVFSGKIICGEHGKAYHRHIYKSKRHGEQEVWNCKLYRQKGKTDGCDSPTIYSKELQMILNDIYKSIYSERDKVISGLMELYESVDGKDYKDDIIKLKSELEKQTAKKDILLELLADGIISKTEFADRNNNVSEVIADINKKIEEYEKEALRDSENRKNMSMLKKIMESEFNEGNYFSAEITSVLLDEIIATKVNGSKTHVKLEIRLNLGKTYVAEIKERTCISLSEIGISQAQVSRLEKNALAQMKKYFV